MHRQVQRAETAGGLTDDRPSALLRQRWIVFVYVSQRVANHVGRISAVVDGVNVLGTTQTREAVDDREQHGRHPTLHDQPVGPLHDIGFPGPRAHERRDVAGVAVQHVQNRIALRTAGIEIGRRVDGQRAHARIAERIVAQRR